MPFFLSQSYKCYSEGPENLGFMKIFTGKEKFDLWSVVQKSGHPFTSHHNEPLGMSLLLENSEIT